MTIVISPMKDTPPPPCGVASALQLHTACAQLAPALQLLLSEIIIKADAIASKAAALAEQRMLGLSIWKVKQSLDA